MKWIVHNAVNRDVERQQLNKILSDISATIDAVDKRVQNNTNVQDAVGAMVSNNIETGISVDYDRARKVLNFVLSSYVLTLTGDVSGSATIDGSGNVTLDVELNEDLVGVEEAPIDTTAYWRKDAAWEQVDPSLEALALLTGTGFPARAIDDFEPVWNMREFEGPMSVVVTNGTGEAGNPSFALVNDEVSPGNMETYSTNNLGVKGWYKPALFESTGLLDGGVLSINGSNPATFDISQAIVGYTDYTTNAAAPTRNVAVYGPSTGNAVTNIAATATYVGIDTPGLTVVQQTSPFTATQRRTIVALGAVVSNGTQLIAINNLPLVMRAGINQIQDLMEAIGPINKSGNLVSPNGANLQINKSAGVLFKQGSNFDSNEEDPHNKALAALTAANFNYRLSNGTQFATTNSIDTANYEAPLGTLADIPTANKWTIQRVYIFTSNLIRIQYGQNLYATLAEAESSIATEAFTTEQNIADNGTLIGFILVRDGATDLSNTADAKFIPASKFGGPVGTGGTSILNTDSLPEGSANLYFTDARAQAAVVIDSIADGDTTHAPSRNAVFDSIAGLQPLDATLTALAATDWAANALPIGTGTNTLSMTSFNINTFPGRSSTGNLVAKAITDQGFTLLAAPTTTNLPEGTNLYFTDARARTAVLTTTITNGDTTHAPDGNAVFDALALKQDTIAAGTTAQWYRGDFTFTNELMGNIIATTSISDAAALIVNRYSEDSIGPQMRSVKSRGSLGAHGQVLNGDTILTFQGRGHDGTNFTSNVGAMSLQAIQNFTSTAQGTEWDISTVGVGSTTRLTRMLIDYTGVRPGLDNSYTLGTSTARWSTLYAVNGFRSGALYETGVSSMASLAANTDNWVITNMANVAIVRMGSTGAARTLTGIVAPTSNGQKLTLVNITTLDVILAHDTTSTAANRFVCPGSVNYTLRANAAVQIWYDNTTARWRVLGA